MSKRGSTTYFFFLFLKMYLFIYFWLHWDFIATHGPSLVAASGGYSSLQCAVFSLRCFSCCGARALGVQASVVVAHRLSSCGSRSLEHRLSSCGARAPRHVGSSQTRAETRVLCIGRWILNHCAAREVPTTYFLYSE